MPRGRAGEMAETIKFLDNRHQVAMNAGKKDKAKERSEGCPEASGSR